jgi:DNA invertase Pin-like site-specific DNA recombinase
MVMIIGGIAEFERELIRARTGDGIQRAKAAGVRMGRPPKLTKRQAPVAIGIEESHSACLGLCHSRF